MKGRLLKVIISVLSAFFPIIMPAADLPVLPANKIIVRGLLENGISYYVVPNKSETGRLDITLVQRSGFSAEDSLTRGLSVVHTRGALAALPRFKTPSPLRYLVANSVWPGPEGYVASGSDATVFRFRNVPVTSTLEAVDSTLLMVFEIINAAPGAVGGYYPHGSQAIIVSGDIDASIASGKLNMLSMLVARRDSREVPYDYVWKETALPDIKYTSPAHPSVTTFSMTWRSPRTPLEQMASIQPLMGSLLLRELCALTEKRLRSEFKTSGLAVAGLEAGWTGSDATSGDELFSVSFSVAPKELAKAAKIAVATMAAIDLRGAYPLEYNDVAQQVKTEITFEGDNEPTTNIYYTERCLSSFLYGSSLASEKTKASFLTGRNMDAALSQKLFNGFVAALLDGSKNLSIVCSADSVRLPREKIKTLLSDAWQGKLTNTHPIDASQGDSLSLAMAPSKKVKISEVVSDPMAGGQVYSFSNGLRVVYKKTSTPGLVRFSWNQKGGYSMISGLKKGEEAYVSDMLFLSNIGPLRGQRFKDMLSANGITMDVEVLPNELSIHASAPAAKLPLLLKAFCAIANKRTVDANAYDLYRQSESLSRVSERGADLTHEYMMDSLLCPWGLYSVIKRDIKLSKDLPSKVESYFARQFQNMKGGVMIITGDVEEEAMRRMLLSYIGRLPGGTLSPPRFRSEARFSTSRRTVILPSAEDPSIDIGLTVPVGFDLGSFISSGIAAEAVRAAVCKAIVPLGWSCSSRWEFDMFPDERLSVKLHLEKADYRGVPASMIQEQSAEVVLKKAREALKELKEKGIPETTFSRAKAYMIGDCNSWLANPDYLLRLFELRYNYGKDFSTGVDAKASKVTVAQASSLVSALLSSGAAEIIVPAEIKEEPIIEPVLAEPEAPYYERPVTPVDSTLSAEGDNPGKLDKIRDLFLNLKK